ncbi:similar to Saccharomyces cerevisiae YHR029C YHI9 Protein of unknown function [Maudiozyma saulgeensis]|uniref:Phenazine biosynthesis protein n=1 Tax=Maudiozyma saulgeensis TaxID=1789683 RepID=A0A1X7R5D9_9SACH|nr:similar to Saccharomyces cerevisiae YHR029C YHI9 Protein of unknown function [Kazachstania saulgeensis]
MPHVLPFKQVDVFTAELYKGNPVAVTNCMGIDESEVTTEQLQAIATWTNLSETTFLFKPTEPGCDYKLRIFTPKNELPFAGHPTVGSCKAFIEFTGTKKEKIVQQCGLGHIELSVTDDQKISFKAGKTIVEDISDDVAKAYEATMGIKSIERPRLLKVGPNWVVFLVKDSDEVLKIDADFAAMSALDLDNDHTGVIVGGLKTGCTTGDAYEIRAFAPSIKVPEDPVCGSGTLSFLRYLNEINQYKEPKNLHITQGARVGRNGNLYCKIDTKSDGNADYYVGGYAIAIVNGTITL